MQINCSLIWQCKAILIPNYFKLGFSGFRGTCKNILVDFQVCWVTLLKSSCIPFQEYCKSLCFFFTHLNMNSYSKLKLPPKKPNHESFLNFWINLFNLTSKKTWFLRSMAWFHNFNLTSVLEIEVYSGNSI